MWARRVLAILVCFLLIHGYAYPQSSYTLNDSVQIYALLDKADEEDLKGEIDLAIHTVNKALSLSKSKKMSRGEGFALLKMADLSYKKTGKGTEKFLFEKPRQIGLELKDSFLTGLSYHQEGQYRMQINQYKEALPLLENAKSYYQSGELLNYRALVFNEIGFVKDRLGQREGAMENYLNAVRIFEEIGNKKEAANSLGNVAIVLYRQGRVEDAIKIFKECAATRKNLGDIKGVATTYTNIAVAYTNINIDSAVHYQQIALPFVQKSGTIANQAQAYASLAVLLSKQKKPFEALDVHDKALALYEQAGDEIKIANQNINKAETYNQLRQFEEAERCLQIAEAIGIKLKSHALLQNVYLVQTKIYETNKDFNAALIAHKNYEKYKDSLLKETNIASINELQIRYETEKKDNEIKRLETEQRIKALELEKQIALNKGNKLEAEKKEAAIQLLKSEQLVIQLEVEEKEKTLKAQELLVKNKEQELLLSQQALEIADAENELAERKLKQEKIFRNSLFAGMGLITLIAGLLFNRYNLQKKIKEQKALLEVRNKISKNLHDDIGSTLTSIHILSNVSEQAIDKDPVRVKEMLHTISGQSKQVQQNMSDIVWAIRPDNDKIGNLIARMREYIGQSFEPQGISASLHVDDSILEMPLPMDYRKEVLLIYKEAMNNVLKHAQASEVDISLTKQAETLNLTIKDNGQWKHNPHASGTGSQSMRERASNIGGKLEVEEMNDGTMVSLSAPIP
jgi:signal transduction histidine kinase